jgi:hypothetical protein
MVASLENTMTKWRAVHNALLRANRGKLRRTAEVRRHNAPAYRNVYNHFNSAFNADNHNLTRGGSWIHGVRVYFDGNPNKREHITAAYNKLNNMARELAAIRAKAVAASKIQRHWRTARPGIMNKRRATALMAMRTLPNVSNTRRVAFELAFPRPVYGPNNEFTALRRYRKYNTY